MNPPANMLEFLASHAISVVATVLPDGSVHAATVHFAHSQDPLTLYISTDKDSRKCQGVVKGETAKASMVVGFSEEEWKTVQMDGTIRAITDKAELEKIHEIYYGKHPNARHYKDDPATLFLAFTPNWWRYSDYNTEPPEITES